MSKKSKRYTIAVIPGDGIGKEIMSEALKALDAVREKFHHDFVYTRLQVGGDAWDQFGAHLPDSTLKGCRASDAILFGAVGGHVDSKEKKWQGIEKNVILALRKEFELFANIRPIHSSSCDFIIVRELTSGIYFGDHRITSKEMRIKGRKRKVWIAEDVMRYADFEIERVIRVASEIACGRKKRLTVVDKANVLETSRLWRTVAEKVKKEYKDIEFGYMYVDNAAYQIARDPKQFDVIVTSNLFGDILSDEAAVWVASLGMIPSASLGVGRFGLYEPIHGSAPSIAGLGIANPTGMIRSAALMLRHSFGLEREAACINEALDSVLVSNYGTPDLNPKHTITTSEFGERVARCIAK